MHRFNGIVNLNDVIDKSKEEKFTVFSLFAGAGGSSTGYKMAGGKIIGINEYSKDAVNSYLDNYPNTKAIVGDIREITANKILQETNLKVRELDILDGSPPCTSFSSQGSREKLWGKEKKSKDNGLFQRTDDLFLEYSRILKGLQPKTFIAENVKGLTSGTALSLLGFPKEFLNYISKNNSDINDYKYIKHIVPEFSSDIDDIGELDISYYKELFIKLAKKYSDIANNKSNSYIDESMNFSKELEDAGYKICYRVLKGSSYGVAQIRERLIIVGIRNDLAKDFSPSLPESTHLEPDMYEKYLQARSRINFNNNKHDVRDLVFGEMRTLRDDEWAKKEYYPLVKTKDVISHLINDVPDALFMPGSETFRRLRSKRTEGFIKALKARLKYSKVSINEEDINHKMLFRPDNTSLELSVIKDIMKAQSGKGLFVSNFSRNYWESQAPALVSSSRLLHPKLNRIISSKEGLNIMSLPENYVLNSKSHTQNWSRIGNAVAPKMMMNVSNHLYNTVLKHLNS